MAGFGSLAAAAPAAPVASTSGAPAMALPTLGQGLSGDSPVAVVVEVPPPWYAARVFVTSRMRDTIAQWRAIPGLNFEASSFARADGHYGRLPPRKDMARAHAWFTQAWRDRPPKQHGRPAGSEWVDTPILQPGQEGHGAWMKGVDPS